MKTIKLILVLVFFAGTLASCTPQDSLITDATMKTQDGATQVSATGGNGSEVIMTRNGQEGG